MDFTQDLREGTLSFLNRIQTKLQQQTNDIGSVFRYWTTYFIIQYLKIEAKFNIEFDQKESDRILSELKWDTLKNENSSLPVLACTVKHPINTVLLLTIESTPQHNATSTTPVITIAKELINSETIFRYHAFIFTAESPHNLLIWDTYRFPLDSKRLIEISKWIAKLYTTFDYHEIVQTSTLVSVTTNDCLIISTGPNSEKSLSPFQTNPIYLESTFIDWSTMFFQLIRHIRLLKEDVHILYPANFLQKMDEFVKLNKDDSFANQIFLYPLEAKSLIEEDKKDPFFQSTIAELIRLYKEDKTKLWSTFTFITLCLKMIRLIMNQKKKSYIILALPARYKFWIDALLPQFIGKTPEMRVLLPNTNRVSFALFIPFQLDYFPWIPNLLHNQQWWFTTKAAQDIYDRIDDKKIVEPYLSKDLQTLTIWNQNKKRSEMTLVYKKDKNTIETQK